MYYVRYAGDFIKGFIKPCKEVMEIHNKITNKLEKLLLKINFVKSNICHSSSKNTKYLGVYARYFQHNKSVEQENGESADAVTLFIK